LFYRSSSKCKILTSAKRPLVLAWNKMDEFSGESDQLIEVIFKQGDDLRQDMLTLQILKLMDYIWKQEGLDMK
jgi:translation initiation factor IF-2